MLYGSILLKVMDSDENNEYRSKLIALVYKHKILWNRTNKIRVSRDEKIQTWNSVANELGKPTDMVRRNWKSLRDQHNREVRRQVINGIAPSWIFYDEMSFLRKMGRRKIKTKKLSSNVIHKQDNFMTKIYHSADNEKPGQEQQSDISDSPPQAKSRTQAHRPFKMEVDSGSVEQIKQNVSMKPPNGTANEVLVEITQVPKNNIINLGVKTKIRRRRKRRAVNNHWRAQYLTRHRSTQPSTIAKPTTTEENVPCKNDISLAQTQLEKEAVYTSEVHRLQIQPVIETPTCIEIPENEIEGEEVVLIKDEKINVSELNSRITAAALESTTKILKSIPVECDNKRKSEVIKESTDKEDDDYHFVISLLPTLRRISHDRKLATRMEIMKVVMKAAQSDKK